MWGKGGARAFCAAPRRGQPGIAQLPHYCVCAGPTQHQTHIDSSCATHTPRAKRSWACGAKVGRESLAPRRAARAGIAQLPHYFVCAGPIQHQTHIDSRCATHTPCPDPCGWRRKTQLGLWGTGYQNRLRRAARGGIAQLPHCFVCPGPIQNQTRPGSSCAGRPSRLCRWCWQRGPWLCLCAQG